MLKCVRIIISYNKERDHQDKTFLPQIQTHAQSYIIEGSLQQHSNGAKNIITIIACGDKAHIDNFMDALYKDLPHDAYQLEIEPFIKEKDYRGVFRIII